MVRGHLIYNPPCAADTRETARGGPSTLPVKEIMDFTDTLLDRLRGHVFHVTSLSSFRKIQTDGFIDTNEKSQYKTPFGFPSSYGRRKGYVCLFDLREKSNEDIRFAHDCLPFTHPTRQLGPLVAYLLLAESAFTKLISPEMAVKDVGAHRSMAWIPRIECWFPGQITLDFVSSVLSVDFDRETVTRLELANHRQQTYGL